MSRKYQSPEKVFSTEGDALAVLYPLILSELCGGAVIVSDTKHLDQHRREHERTITLEYPTGYTRSLYLYNPIGGSYILCDSICPNAETSDFAFRKAKQDAYLNHAKARARVFKAHEKVVKAAGDKLRKDLEQVKEEECKTDFSSLNLGAATFLKYYAAHKLVAQEETNTCATS